MVGSTTGKLMMERKDMHQRPTSRWKYSFPSKHLSPASWVRPVLRWIKPSEERWVLLNNTMNSSAGHLLFQDESAILSYKSLKSSISSVSSSQMDRTFWGVVSAVEFIWGTLSLPTPRVEKCILNWPTKNLKTSWLPPVFRRPTNMLILGPFDKDNGVRKMGGGGSSLHCLGGDRSYYSLLIRYLPYPWARQLLAEDTYIENRAKKKFNPSPEYWGSVQIKILRQKITGLASYRNGKSRLESHFRKVFFPFYIARKRERGHFKLWGWIPPKHATEVKEKWLLNKQR